MLDVSDPFKETFQQNKIAWRMGKQVLFIQGGGDDGYDTDALLVDSLKTVLGKDYLINYPKIKEDESAADFGWLKEIGENITEMKDNFILIGHSFGASMILKFLSENPIQKEISGIFLIATPFWKGNEEWKLGLKLIDNFSGKLPVGVPIYLYHCTDDEEVPISHFYQYKQKRMVATFYEIPTGGHQFNNDLSKIARDIQLL